MAAAQVVAKPRNHQRHVLEVGAQIDQFVDRQRPVRDLRTQMRILGCRRSRRNDPHPRDRIIAELAGARDHRHRPDRRLEFAHHPAKLDRDIGDAAAEPAQRQPLEHQVAEPAIGGRLPRPLPRLDQAVGRLRLGAAIEAQREVRRLEQLAIRPDAAQPLHLALAQPHREAGDDLGLLGLRRTLGAGGLRSDFLEFGRPDDIAAQSSPAIEARHRCALARALQADVGACHRLGLFGEEHAVDCRAGQRAQRPADGGANRPAQRAAHHLAGQRKCECCHCLNPVRAGNGRVPRKGKGRPKLRLRRAISHPRSRHPRGRASATRGPRRSDGRRKIAPLTWREVWVLATSARACPRARPEG